MAEGRDKFVVESSLGAVTVQWAWNKWVVVDAPGSKTVRARVERRRGLATLLVEAGLPSAEAASVAHEAWRERPASSKHGETEPWGNPWRRLRFGTLAVVLAGLVAMVLCVFWLKLYWVAL